VSEATIPSADRPASPQDIYRELSEGIARTETLGRTIEANLDDAEREIEAIRQATYVHDAGLAPGSRGPASA